MIADLGGFSLFLVMALSLATMAIGFLPNITDQTAMPYLKRGHRLLILLTGWSFAALITSFINSDFGLRIVADNSALDSPLFYKITASWGNHEGSMLLWLVILCLYGAAMTKGKWQSESLQRTALAVHAATVLGISAFVTLASNPFEMLVPRPHNGAGMNPLLEDVGLAIHPPVLYMGYVGFAAVFSIAFAGLWRSISGKDIFNILHIYAMFALGWLTLGIGLGSWWAYRELGWGGWWFWDPVENASLLPWLTGLALCHSIAASRKKGLFNNWTLLLALSCFSMSLIGTFLVRSGVVTSVHSFASDPTRGVFILSAIGAITGGSLLLYAIRAKPAAAAEFAPVSRESFLLLQSAIAALSAAIVLLGTLYPMLSQLMGMRAVSVGASYFSSALMPVAILTLISGAMAHLMRWGSDDLKKLFTKSWPDAITAAAITIIMVSFVTGFSIESLLLSASGGFMLSAGIRYIIKSPSNPAMPLSHIGAALIIIGTAASVLGQHSRDVTIQPDSTVNIGEYRVHYDSYSTGQRANYTYLQAKLIFSKNGDQIDILQPEKRLYSGRPSMTSEAATANDRWNELYAVIGDNDEKGVIGARIYITPLIDLVWLGFLFISSGCWFAANQKPRYTHRNSIIAMSI